MHQFSKFTQCYFNESFHEVTVSANSNMLPNASCAQAVCFSLFPSCYMIERVIGENINCQARSIFILKVIVSIQLYKEICCNIYDLIKEQACVFIS